VPEPVVAPAEQTNGQAPSAEAFRDALLQAISQRTGYPIDVLDENVPLEAGLGIDSIKKVEIFSNLKEYHKYFQDEDSNEEDVLEAFSQLKTLQDIVEYYARRRSDYLGAAAKADSHPAGNGSAGKNEVRRMTLTAVESPLEAGNGQKKNSPRTI
jgi:acyl carrier protein